MRTARTIRPGCLRQPGVLALLLLTAPLAAADPSATEHFERHVRPLLAEHCVGCHGPKKQQGGLRLDSRDAALKGGDSGPALVPGKPDDSLIVQAVTHTGPLKMPPKGPLPAAAAAALAAWVREGAPWPAGPARPAPESTARDHWAFRPVRDPKVPENDGPTPIDRFIRAALAEKGLTAGPEADRRTLARRLSFDLTGLPPTPEEVEAFEKDPAPAAVERLVDRLLASPHFGERWGRYWLDVARYADTKGYVFFEDSAYPWAWTYRDYVVRSFNEDKPYDRFVLEQIAADRLDLGPDRRPLTALGFLTAGNHFMNNPHDQIDDRIDVVLRGLQGLTVTCARCHDHKFDPIPTRDYYSLYGVFASSREPAVLPLFAPPPETPEYAAFARELDAREGKLAAFLKGKWDALLKTARTRAGEYLLAAHARRGQPDAEEFMLLADGNDLNPAMLQRWQRWLERSAKGWHPVMAPWHSLADVPADQFAARLAELLAGWQKPADATRRVNPILLRALAATPPRSREELAALYNRVLNAAQPGTADSDELRAVFDGPDAAPNPPPHAISELELLPDRPAQGELQKLRKPVEEWRATGPGAPPRAMVLEDLPEPYNPRVFLRGNPGNPGEAVPRQFLAVLAGPGRKPFADGSGRLELAKAIASPDNPLTARVFVNRVWMHLFGEGLVRTPGDFGLRGEPPTHPELLDHFAAGFVRDGWSVKRLIRRIVLSAAYRQSSADRADARKADPENRLLARQNRRRLDWEATRDTLLAVSGRLDRSVGGPPAGDALSTTRRTLYARLDRLNVPGLYRAFDFPSPDATSPRRDSTTTAPQALFLMNHAFPAECGKHLLSRPDLKEAAEPAIRSARIFRAVLARPATPAEARLAAGFLGEKPDAAAWERFTHALLLSNELVFVE